jgi:AAA+ superfamily predicted ATPase
MVLTTNRITSLDIAVQSRIHLAIRYDDLDKNQKIQIFNLFLDQLKLESEDELKAIKDWIKEDGSDYDLNGRQIRNVVSSAQALARSEGKGKQVEKRHIRKVMAVTKEFQLQLEPLTRLIRENNEVGRVRR